LIDEESKQLSLFIKLFILNFFMELINAKISDAKFLFEMKQETEFKKYFPSRIIPKRQIDQENEIKEFKKLLKKQKFFIFIAKEKERVGFVEIYKVNKKDNRCAIGFGIQKDQWNNGFGTNAVKEVIKFIKNELNLHTIEATVFPGNITSEKILKKTGFTKIGLMKDYYYSENKYIDRILYWKVL
jgi:[ribosomal protein S5]-alanine N-acetyltransferase